MDYITNYYSGVEPDTDQARTELYECVHQALQTRALWAARHMGNRCDFICNPGLAIYRARQNEFLSAFGWKLQRAQGNTHLATGLPMYVAGMAILHGALGLGRMDLSWYPTDTTDSTYASTDTGETVETAAAPTRSLVWMARVCGEV